MWSISSCAMAPSMEKERGGSRSDFQKEWMEVWIMRNKAGSNEAVLEQESLGQEIRKRKKKKKRKLRYRILLWLFLIILAAVLAVAGYVAYVVITAPTIDTSRIYDLLNTTSMVYDDNGDELEAVGTAESRTLVTYDEIPDILKNSFIAIEDKTFYEHSGFNIVRVIGAVRNSIFSGDRIGGTSTITQQLARNLYLSSERSIDRKIKEAYYTLILENDLTKNQILEAYLNTIYLGNNSSGVKAAAKSYFGLDDLNQLSIAECAMLASIPKSPSANSPIKKVEMGKVDEEADGVLGETSDGSYVYMYSDGYRSRQELVLKNMKEQGFITAEEYKQAMDESIQDELKPTEPLQSNVTTYFSDYCLDEVTEDLMAEYDIDESTAANMVYNKGLKIFSTLNVEMQEIAEEQFSLSGNFPSVTNLHRDSSRNITGTGKKRSTIILYYKDNYFKDDGSFVLSEDEFKMDDKGNLVILKGNRLNIYRTSSDKPQIEFKKMYDYQNYQFTTIDGGYFPQLEYRYLSFDDDGNAVVSKKFLDANPDFFQIDDEKGTASIAEGNYELSQSSIQPQGAMVISDFKTGQIKVMVGGRGDNSGKMLYNRAIQSRQPGSSIKPIAVYGPAIESGVDKGTRYTAGSTVEDSPTRNGWPKNWYSGYRGYVTLRTAVEQSINVVSVKIVNDIGYDYSVEMLKKNGVSSITERSGDSEGDYNPAALGLGGMLKGISPMEMAAAYGTFANGGVHIDPTTYTKVEDSQGNVILESHPEETQVYDEGVAWIMTDILRTTVTRGIAGSASIGVQPVAGKTGTTSDNFDAWFVGLTPQYAVSCWIGNDVNIQLSRGSAAAAALWSRVMRRECAKLDYGSFGSPPDDVYSSGGEYYVNGTKSSGKAATWKSGQSTDSNSSNSGNSGSSSRGSSGSSSRGSSGSSSGGTSRGSSGSTSGGTTAG
ncbi:MAG: PBP1A family penicillin-binding protein [Firmicutes bacterium]|nr:PBP1A family penicillin-binding protein [Bacillota bacterium]